MTKKKPRREVEEEPDPAPAPYKSASKGNCRICRRQFKKGERRTTCSNADCPAPYVVHWSCIDDALEEVMRVKIKCKGCGKKEFYRTKWAFRNFSWLWKLVGVLAAILVLFGPFYLIVYFSSGEYVPGHSYSIWNQIVSAGLVWFLFGAGLTLIWRLANCCCWPLFLCCGTIRKSGQINY
jgi:hypothetical protein